MKANKQNLEIAKMLGITNTENWNPDTDWNHLMSALDFIENLPRQPKSRSKKNNECIIHDLDFTRMFAAITANIYTEKNGWTPFRVYNDYGDFVDVNKNKIDSSKFKKQLWYRTISEFAEFYNKNKIPFLK